MADQDPEGQAPIPCPPCRGTGKLISGLGGTPTPVVCPWCDGEGIFSPERDAQAEGPAIPAG